MKKWAVLYLLLSSCNTVSLQKRLELECKERCELVEGGKVTPAETLCVCETKKGRKAWSFFESFRKEGEK